MAYSQSVLKTQIENITVSSFLSSIYDDWLIAGARTIVDILKPEDLERHSSSTTIPPQGLSVVLYRIWRILVGNNYAIQRDAGNETQVIDSNSFYKATSFTPAYIIKAGTLKCYNGVGYATSSLDTSVVLNNAGSGYSVNDIITLAGGMTVTVASLVPATTKIATFTVSSYGTTAVSGSAVAQISVSPTGGSGATFDVHVSSTGSLIGIQYPTAIDSSADKEITGVPENMHYAVVLYAAIQARIKQLSDLMKTTLPALTRATTTAPTALSVPSFTYSSSAVTIGSLGTPPTYTKPTITMTTALSDLDLSSIVAPTVPSAPTFTYTDATAATVASTSIGSLGTPPTYTKPTIGTLPSSLTISDLDISSITAPTSPTLTSVTYVDATGATVAATTIGSIPSVPTYTPVSPSSEIATAVTEFNTQMTVAEDIELAKPQLEKINVLLQEYQSHIQEHLGAFNADIKKFDSDVQKVLDQSKVTMQEALENAKLSTDVSMQNKIQTMTAIIQNNNSLLQKYQDDVAKYSHQVNALVAQHQSNTQSKVQVYTNNVKTILETFTIDIQNELNEYNKELAIYQSTVQSAIKTAEIASAKVLADAQLTTEISKQNKLYTLQSSIDQYKETLAKYSGDLQRYQLLISSSINQYQANTKKWETLRATELQKYSTDIQNEMNVFQEELSIYQSTVQAAIKDGEFALQKALQDGNQNLAKEIQQYDGYIKKYNSEIQKYQTDIQNVIQGFQADVASIVQQHQGLTISLQQLQSEYHSLIDQYLGRQSRQSQEQAQ